MSSASPEPKVSVIIPLYNMSAYIGAAIESVLAQSFRDWDAWIVDDGSKDNGPEIAQRYAAAHPDRIHYLEHDGHANRGVSASRNLALAHCHGEFVAFLDADDLWSPDKLELQAKVMADHPEVGLVYSSAIPIHADGKPWSPSQDGEAPVKIVLDREGQPRVGYGTPDRPVALFDELVRHCCLVNSSVVVRSSLLDRVGRFDPTLPYQCEDWLLFTEVAYHAPAYFVGKPLMRYRIHSTNYSSTRIRKNQLAEFSAAAVFLRRLPAHLGVRDEGMSRLLAESRDALFGRALSRAEDAWHRGQYKEALTFIRFAYASFPRSLFSRRTARFVRTIVAGKSVAQTA